MSSLRQTIVEMFSEASEELRVLSPLYHVSNYRFSKFDKNFAAQGVFWFSTVSFADSLEDLHGASINGKKPIYLYTCSAKVKKTAGWAEYEKYSLFDLESMGFDSIELDDDVVIFNPKSIKIDNVKVVNKNEI